MAHQGGEKPRECPECHSEELWKDGKRKTSNGLIQRFLCRNCGYRFSENYYKEYLTTNSRQICALNIERVKNLVKVEPEKIALRESTAKTKGLLVSLSFWMLREGYRETTIYVTCQRLKHLLKLGAILSSQESTKEVIAQQKWQEGTKLTYVNAYAKFCEMQGILLTNRDIKSIIRSFHSFQQKQN